MFSSSPLDWVLIVAYFGFLGVVWFTRRGKRSGVIDYLVAGRAVTLPALVATLVTTWYGGILGIGEYSYRYGLSNWLVFGVPYYVGALLFAMLFAKRARQTELFTIPDLLDRHYGRGPVCGGRRRDEHEQCARECRSTPIVAIEQVGDREEFGLPRALGEEHGEQ